MSDWDALLARLAEAPRENGTAALHRAAGFLGDALAEAGADVDLVAYVAEPYGLRLAGVLALAGAILYARLVWAGRAAPALAVAIAVPLALLAQLDYRVPVFGWVGAQTQHHVRARIPARAPEQRLVFAAHYDTKTDLLDHVERAPVDALAAPIIPAMWLGGAALLLARRWTRARRALVGTARVVAVLSVVYGAGTFAALSAGAFVPARSPGAIDDGASCAVLVRLAQALVAGAPLERTEVEVLLLSGEEIGVQGSWEYASRRFSAPPDLPTRVVNLEGIGQSARHAVLGGERFTLRGFDPDPEVVALLGRAHRRELGEPLERTWYAGATDARSFLAHGVPAATLVTRPPAGELTRGLHSSEDARSRLDERALDETLRFLRAVVREADAPVAGPRATVRPRGRPTLRARRVPRPDRALGLRPAHRALRPGRGAGAAGSRAHLPGRRPSGDAAVAGGARAAASARSGSERRSSGERAADPGADRRGRGAAR